MNRYEFEDKISDYLENQLRVSERKAFEEYIKDNNEDRELLNSIIKTIDLINAQKSIKTSQKFMQNLINKVNSHKKTPTKQNNSHNKKLFFDNNNDGSDIEVDSLNNDNNIKKYEK